ncbi:MAG TPA: hypothetical protein DD670_00640 [Planctomycetaceae bacterium]|nr:hypothetical protein [Planctomycetaceae bacterium]
MSAIGTMKGLCLDVLRGRPTDRVPFCPDISDWYSIKRLPPEAMYTMPTGSFIPDDAPFHADDFGMPEPYKTWTYLDFFRNFGWSLHAHIYDWCDFEYDSCEYRIQREGRTLVKEFKTPKGDLRQVYGMAADGSLCVREHFVKSLADWDTVAYIIQHTQPVARYGHIRRILDGIGDLGVADLVIFRSPFGKVLVEYAGLETTTFHLMDARSRLLDVMQLQESLDLRVVDLAAQSDADIVILSDHADQQLISPAWYSEFCVPYYREVARRLHASNKLFSTHMDGKFKALFALVRQTGVDILDGCTPAPIGNYEVEELPLAMTDAMRAYCGVPSIFFSQNVGMEEILSCAERIIQTFRGRLIFNIGDILPSNGDIDKAIALGEWVAWLNRK